MGSQSITTTTLKKENLINTKKVTNKIKTSNNMNFFYDMLAFPEEEKIIVSTPKYIIIFESITFKLIKTLEIKNLKVLQKIDKSIDSKIDRIYSFYASKEGTYASIILLSINFNDYTIDTKELIRKHMPKYYFINFFVLSINLIILAFNKGTIMIFDEPNILIDDDKDNSLPVEKERQIFKFNNEINLNEQNESCGFFEVSDTCFIGITSMGGLRFYDFNESTGKFTVNNYMEGYWANPHSKNSIILVGNKLICAYKDITIIDVNKRLIVQQIKSPNINGGIIYLKNETIILVSDYMVNSNTKNMKRIVQLHQFVLVEEILDEDGKKSLKHYNYSSGDLEGLSNVKTLTPISKKG